jgi:hypothetical protein
VAFVRGTKAIEVNFHGLFGTDADAKAFAGNLRELSQLATSFLKTAVKIDTRKTELLTSALESVQVEAFDEHVSASLSVSTEVVEAAADTLRELPLSLFNKLLNKPGGL